MKNSIIFICIIGLIFTICFQILNPRFGTGDFLAYWSSSRLLISGGNPYDHAALSALEHSTVPALGPQSQIFLNTWNPPWLILIFSLFGSLPFSIASPIWIFCNTVLIGLALIISWQLCERNRAPKGILFVFLAGYLFGETLSYLVLGQITSLVLTGLVLSIYLIDRKLDFLAGATLLLTTIKPHVSYFFLLIVLIWIIQNRRWRILLGLVLSASFSLIVFWIINPNWVANYITLITGMPYSSIYTSTLGSFMAAMLKTNIFYFLVICLLFLIKPLLQILKSDGWLTVMNISLLLALPLSPFGFSFDQIVILPAIVQIIAWLSSDQFSRKATRIIIASLFSFYVIVYGMFSIPNLENYWFFVLPILFLPIYILSWKNGHADQKLSYGT